MILRSASILFAIAASMTFVSCSRLDSFEETALTKLDKIRGRAPIVNVDREQLQQFKTGEELALAYKSAVRRNRETGEALPSWIIDGDFDDLVIPELGELDGQVSVLPTKPQ